MERDFARPLFLDPATGEPSYPIEGTISPAEGPAGTTVTINGVNFSTLTGQTRVFFGGSARGHVRSFNHLVRPGDQLHRDRPDGLRRAAGTDHRTGREHHRRQITPASTRTPRKHNRLLHVKRGVPAAGQGKPARCWASALQDLSGSASKAREAGSGPEPGDRPIGPERQCGKCEGLGDELKAASMSARRGRRRHRG